MKITKAFGLAAWQGHADLIWIRTLGERPLIPLPRPSPRRRGEGAGGTRPRPDASAFHVVSPLSPRAG
ncbi:hypothetical protein CN142_33855, partial [Sinorhizobium meliloti]